MPLPPRVPPAKLLHQLSALLCISLALACDQEPKPPSPTAPPSLPSTIPIPSPTGTQPRPPGTPPVASCAQPGGAVNGTADAHCGTKAQAVDMKACHADKPGTSPGIPPGTPPGTSPGTPPVPPAIPPQPSPPSPGGTFHSLEGTPDPAPPDVPEEPALAKSGVLYNTEGDDEDCKYHLKWSSTPLCTNQGATFTLTVTHKTDGSPAAGAQPVAEIFLDANHPAPHATPQVTEEPQGIYHIGPVLFDAPGRWTVRFHLYGNCNNASETSPHGHGAFYVNISGETPQGAHPIGS